MDYDLFLSLNQANKDSKYYFTNGIPLDIPKYYKNLLDNRYHKTSRIKKMIIYMLSRRKYMYFITFTFNNNYINKCDRTKKDLIKNVLNDVIDNDFLYMLNVDYGTTTEREHYHCLLATDYLFNISNYLDLCYPCFTKTEQVRIDNKDISRLSKYINKLSNHATKQSTHYNRIYYNFKGYNIYKNDSKLGWVVYTLDKHKLGL